MIIITVFFLSLSHHHHHHQQQQQQKQEHPKPYKPWQHVFSEVKPDMCTYICQLLFFVH
jgi:hypothetical protein